MPVYVLLEIYFNLTFWDLTLFLVCRLLFHNKVRVCQHIFPEVIIPHYFPRKWLKFNQNKSFN
jgi:hypothetical protein